MQFSRQSIRATISLYSISLLLTHLTIVDTVHAAPTIFSTIDVVEDGGNPFDSTTYDPGTSTNTGTDSSSANGIVKAGSFIKYKVDVTVNDEGAEDVYFQSTLPVGFTWETFPQNLACLTSGVTPASSVTNGGRTILCNMGDTAGGAPGTVSVVLRANVSAGTANDTQITLTGDVFGSSVGGGITGIGGPANPANPVIVTKLGGSSIPTVPNIDISKRAILPGNSLVAIADIPGPDGVTLGRVVPYAIQITNIKGAPGLDANMHITLEDQFTLLDDADNPTTNSARLYTWGPYPGCDMLSLSGYLMHMITSQSEFYGYPNGRGGGINGIPDGQTLNCTQSAPGGPVTLDIDHIDLTNTLNGPTFDMNGNPYASGATHNTAGSYVMYYWVPLTDINNASVTNPTANYRNTITGPGGAPFDPSSSGGLSNYGSGTEPTANNIDNNTSHLAGANALIGSEDPNYITGSYYWSQLLISSITVRDKILGKWGGRADTYGNIRPYFIIDDKYGDRAVLPGETIAQSIRHSFALQANTSKTIVVCEKINPAVIRFTGTYPSDPNISTNFPAGFANMTNPSVYTINPFDGATPTTGSPVTVEYSTTPNIPNDRDATCGATDGPWYSSIALAGGANMVTKMRMSYNIPPQNTSAAIEYRNMMGLTVPLGTSQQVIPIWTSFSQDGGITWNNHNSLYPSSTDGSLNPNSTTYGFIPYIYANWDEKHKITTADRIIVSDAFTRVDKDTIPSGVTTYQVGKPIKFILKPTLTGSTSLTGADLVVRDIMPPEMYYEFGSSSRSLDTGYPALDGSGNTILQWTIPWVIPGDAIPQITYTAMTESTMNSTSGYPNIAEVSYPWDASPVSLRRDTYAVNLVQNSQYSIFKRPIPSEVPIENNLKYIVKYKNFTVAPNIPPMSKYIDILPYNGDGTLGARNKKPTNFHGTYTLLSVSGSLGETFEYTKRPHAQIKNDPCDVSNLPVGTTSQPYCMLGLVGGSAGTATTKWCTPAQFGTPGCPANIGESTAFRMTVPTAVNINQLNTIEINLSTSGNKPGDLYTNTIGTRRQNFNLYTASNQATIHVYGASVGDRVWKDTDSDGIQDIGEVGIGGIGVTLERLSSTGSVIDTWTTTTSPTGIYLFQDLPAGDYRVKVANPGMDQTYDLDGLGTADQTTFSLTAAENKRNVDFGYNPTSAAVGDYVWLDANADGVQDSGELGFSGVTVTLSGTTSTGASINKTMLTDSTGKYLFTGLTAGNYSVAVTPPAGVTQTYDLDGLSTPHVASFALGTTEIKTDVDFGYTMPLGSVGDKLWIDVGGDTNFVSGTDIPLEGILLTLSGTDILGNPVLLTTLTDADGLYNFSGLVAGNYSITVTDPGNVPLFDLDGHTGTSKNIATFTLGAGQHRTDVDFVYANIPDVTGSIGDLVWTDIDGDGVYGTGDTVLSGVTITLIGKDALGSTISLTGVTNSSGNYLFTGLYSGSYLIRVSTPPANHDETYDLDGTGGTLTHPVTSASVPSMHTALASLATGQNRTDVDFGYKPLFGDVSGVVWYDPNASGTAPAGAGEYGFSGVTVTLSGTDNLGNPVSRTLTTTSTGYYFFDSVSPGSYETIVTRTTLPGSGSGYIQTYDPDGLGSGHRSAFALAPGEHKTDINYGYELRSDISGIVWYDPNLSGVGPENVSEYGFSGVTVTLSGTDVNGIPINRTTTTSPVGYYEFDTVAPGNYSVTVSPNTLPNSGNGYIQTFDLNGTGSAHTTAFSYSANQKKNDINFGYHVLAHISGVVWYDPNKSGNAPENAGEYGFSGVTVTLSGIDMNGNIINKTTATSGTGYYEFLRLIPGNYETSVTRSTLPEKVHETFDRDGTGSLDRIAFPLTGGEFRTGVNYGYEILAQVAGIVWHDRNQDGSGALIESETGFSGWIVTLSGTDILGRSVSRTMSTSSGGAYAFLSLVPGSYSTIVTPPADVPGQYIYRQTYDGDGVGTAHRTGFTLIVGEDRRNINYGYVYLPVIPGGSYSSSSSSIGSNSTSVTPPVTQAKNPPKEAPSVPLYEPPKEKIPKNPIEPTPEKNTSKALPLSERIARENAMSIQFILPKRLLDTGAGPVTQDIREKILSRVKIMSQAGILTEPQTYGTPWTKGINTAPRDLSRWIEGLPEEDKDKDMYIVMPTLGVVTPIVSVPDRDSAFGKLVSGKEISLSRFLDNGVLHYPRTPLPGEYGNMVIAGHSSYYNWSKGRYNTVFGAMISLDIGGENEVWIYKKNQNGDYTLYRYRVTASYNTKPTDTNVMLPRFGKKEITLYTCTPIGGISGRWIIRGELIEK